MHRFTRCRLFLVGLLVAASITVGCTPGGGGASAAPGGASAAPAASEAVSPSSGGIGY